MSQSPMQLALHVAREIFDDLGGDQRKASKYSTDEFIGLHRLLKEQCDEAGIAVDIVVGIVANQICKQEPIKAERLRKIYSAAAREEAAQQCGVH